jgi:hypothetical protein
LCRLVTRSRFQELNTENTEKSHRGHRGLVEHTEITESGGLISL